MNVRAADPAPVTAGEPFDPERPGRPGPFEPGTPRSGRPPGRGKPFCPGASPASPSGPSPRPEISADRGWLRADECGDLYQRLLDHRVVLAHGHLDDEAATRLSAQLLTLDAEGDDPVRCELQNLTADLGAALTVMSVLDVVGVPVHARVAGRISGAALGVLAACDDRRAYPSATFTLSEPTVEFGGRIPHILAGEAQTRHLLGTLYDRLAEVTGREVDDIHADVRRSLVLTVEEAVGYGLIVGLATRR